MPGRIDASVADVAVSPHATLIDSIRLALRAVAAYEHPASDSSGRYEIRPRIADPHSVLVRLDERAPRVEEWSRGRSATPVGARGNTLTMERAPGVRRFVYSVGWGDCPSGCTHRHDWIFEVTDDLEVSLSGSRGDPLPPVLRD